MNSILARFSTYRNVFGSRGYWLAVQTRAARHARYLEAVPPGLQHPLHMRTKTCDLDTYTKIFVNREYEIPLRKEPTVIVDAGANAGFSTVFFASKYPKAKVIAIEPETSNFELLKKNTAPYPNVVPLQAALWNENTELELMDPNKGHWRFEIQGMGNGAGGERLVEKVKGMTVDRILSLYGLDHIDILKMDIEGSERAIFANSPAWVSRVGVIMAELHDVHHVGCARNFYVATRDFDHEVQQGENVFVLRKEYYAPA